MPYAVGIRRKGILMIFLLALPVFAAVALAYRFLQLYAPTNRLVRRVLMGAPRLRTAVGLLAAAAVLLIAMHVVAEAVAAGAPGWLNLVVLVLALDAIKLGFLSLLTAARAMLRAAVRLPRNARRAPTSLPVSPPHRSVIAQVACRSSRGGSGQVREI